jgi:hypothetical protein
MNFKKSITKFLCNFFGKDRISGLDMVFFITILFVVLLLFSFIILIVGSIATDNTPVIKTAEEFKIFIFTSFICGLKIIGITIGVCIVGRISLKMIVLCSKKIGSYLDSITIVQCKKDQIKQKDEIVEHTGFNE